MGRRSREWPVEKIRQWIEDEGRTHKAVAAELGCASQTIGKLCKRHGIQSARRGPRGGSGHPNWKGGRTTDKSGYVLIWMDEHPQLRGARRAGGRGGYVREHRLVMERHLGRVLTDLEVVHHMNGVHDDNRIENLELFATNADHLRHELKGRVPNWTEDGKARIRAGVEKAAATNRRRRVAGDPSSP